MIKIGKLAKLNVNIVVAFSDTHTQKMIKQNKHHRVVARIINKILMKR